MEHATNAKSPASAPATATHPSPRLQRPAATTHLKDLLSALAHEVRRQLIVLAREVMPFVRGDLEPHFTPTPLLLARIALLEKVIIHDLPSLVDNLDGVLIREAVDQQVEGASQ